MRTLLSRVVVAGVVLALGLSVIVAQAGWPAEEPANAKVAAQSTETIAGDVDCSAGVDAVDALKILRWLAGLPVSQTDPCTPIGEGAPYIQGDVDCSGNVDVADALKVLRYLAGLPVMQAGDCTPIGGTLPGTGTPTPTAAASATPAPTLGPDDWLGCDYATDWNGGEDTSRVCFDGGQAYPEAMLEGTSCEPDPYFGAVAQWNVTEVPPAGSWVRLRLDMWAEPGDLACVQVSNHIATYEIALSATEVSYYLNLPPITEPGTYTAWVEFRGVNAPNRYAWLDFAALRLIPPSATPTP